MTYVPIFQYLFETEAIPAWVWPRRLLGGFVFFLVVEAEKLIIRSSRRITTPEGGERPGRLALQH